MALRGLEWSDWAQGWLYDHGTLGGPVVLRVNREHHIAIADAGMQDNLRPFIGMGVVYGKRILAADGAVSLHDVYPELRFLRG